MPTPPQHAKAADQDLATGPANPQPDEGRSFLQRWVLSRRAVSLGLAISLAIHLTLLLAASFYVFAKGGGESGSSTASTVQAAVVTDAEFRELMGESLEPDPPPIANLEMPEVLSSAVDMLPMENEFGNLDAEANLGVDLGAGDLVGDSGIGSGGAGGGGASFFGVEATGTRFAYVVDVSGSMGLEGKLQLLKVELIQSIEELLETAEFFVVSFASGAQPLGGRSAWREATTGGKVWARKHINAINAGGGTQPLPAFQEVFNVRPRPDAIYFMTDGEFNAEVASEIIRLNSRRRIPIHCITFVNRDAEELMRRIASHSRGTYTHVEGSP